MHSKAAEWLARAREPGTPEAEAALLTELLQSGVEDVHALVDLARARAARPVVRCAALDQALSHVLQGAELPIGWLVRLANARHESNEDVRAVALQWLADLVARRESGLRDADALREIDEQLRGELGDQLKADPSPRVRWLAALSQSQATQEAGDGPAAF